MMILSNCFKPYKGLPKSIYVLFFASIVNNMGNFVGPFLTMFLTYRVGVSIGLVGIIVAINAGLGLIGTMLGGKLIDSIGRKKVLIVFGIAAGIGYGLCAFISNSVIITGILMVSSFLAGFSQPVYSTITTDLTEGTQRNAAFSLNYMALNIGFSVGPLLAGFLYKNYLMWFFLGDAFTTFLSIGLVSLFVPETKPTKEEIIESGSKTFESAEQGSLLDALIKRPTLLAFSLIIVIYFIVFSQFTFGLSIQIGDIFKSNGSTIFGSLMTVNAVICSLLTVFLGGLLYAIGFGMMFFINSYFMFIISTATWTVGEILVATNTSVYIASHTPITHRGRFNSVFPIIRKLGFMIGPIMAGFYIKYTNIRNLWILIALLALIGSFMMYKLYTVDKMELESIKNKIA
jgi:MFS family permease